MYTTRHQLARRLTYKRRPAMKNEILAKTCDRRYKRPLPAGTAGLGMGEGLLPLLGGDRVVLAAGAHDALSAKLAEAAGFDAVWASGFGISAVQAVPDANILTLTETLEAVRRIVHAVDIPVIADCDNGYGNAINVMRTAGEFERAGAA